MRENKNKKKLTEFHSILCVRRDMCMWTMKSAIDHLVGFARLRKGGNTN